MFPTQNSGFICLLESLARDLIWPEQLSTTCWKLAAAFLNFNKPQLKNSSVWRGSPHLCCTSSCKEEMNIQKNKNTSIVRNRSIWMILQVLQLRNQGGLWNCRKSHCIIFKEFICLSLLNIHISTPEKQQEFCLSKTCYCALKKCTSTPLINQN